MLPLPTGNVSMDVSTDRRHPFHTYNDRNRFGQFELTQQNIVVDINDVERDTEISNGKRSMRHWRLGDSQCFSVISIFWWEANSLILQHMQTYLFLSYFSSPAIIHTKSSLAWEVVQKYVAYIDEPESRKRFAIDSFKSLTFRTKCSNHRVIKKKKKKWCSWLTTISSSYSVQWI